MPLDPQVQRLLQQRKNNTAGVLETVEAQRMAAAKRPLVPGPAVGRVEERTFSGPDGLIPVRIYTPAGEGPFPILVWLRGSGWVIGDMEMHDGTCRHLCNGARALVIAIGYRLAPEAKFPGPLEDCYAGLVWAREKALELNGRPSHMAIGGSSAGANLAAATCLLLKDRSGPSLMHQVLVYPPTDCSSDGRSYRAYGSGEFGLSADQMRWYWNQYLNPEDRQNPYACPLQAQDLSGLPPATIILAEYDVLFDEGMEYATKLESAGVPVLRTCYPGVNHGFFHDWHSVDKAAHAVNVVCHSLKTAFLEKV